MVTLKNIQTGEIIEVSNTKQVGEFAVTRYMVGKRYFNKYGHALEYVSDNGEQQTLKPREGWAFVKNGKRQHEPQPEPHGDDMPEQSHDDEPTMPQEQPSMPQGEAIPMPQAATMPTMDAAVNAFAALTPLFAGVEQNVTANIMAKVQPLLDRVPQEVRHVIEFNGEERPTKPGEVFHPNFDAVCNRIARGIWVYLYGPTGSGKNVMAKQIADALGLPFYYQAHTLDRFELTGFIDANGNYQQSEFYKAYSGGGLFMLDELDASDENALITLNSASNGYFAFPCGTIRAHPNFRVIAAGNTCGRGADEEYTGRRVMDASSLGRFVPRYHGYTREVDMAAADNDEALVLFFDTMRAIKSELGVAMILSPRQIKGIKQLEECEPLSELLRDEIATYLTKDDLQIVENELKNRMEANRYSEAFCKIKFNA